METRTHGLGLFLRRSGARIKELLIRYLRDLPVPLLVGDFPDFHVQIADDCMRPAPDGRVFREQNPPRYVAIQEWMFFLIE